MESNDSPEISDGGGGHQTSLASLRGRCVATWRVIGVHKNEATRLAIEKAISPVVNTTRNEALRIKSRLILHAWRVKYE